jgi:hypothetical protein
MSTRIRRRLAARRHARSSLLFVLLIAVSLALAACGGSTPSTTSTTSHKKLPAVPSGADTSPSVTVESYLNALSHHDVQLAEKLVYPKVRKAIMDARASGFSDLTNLQDVKVLASVMGPQYKPVETGVTFTKYHQFAQVTVSFSATFSSASQPSGPQKRVITVGENSGSKWIIVAVKTST